MALNFLRNHFSLSRFFKPRQPQRRLYNVIGLVLWFNGNKHGRSPLNGKIKAIDEYQASGKILNWYKKQKGCANVYWLGEPLVYEVKNNAKDSLIR